MYMFPSPSRFFQVVATRSSSLEISGSSLFLLAQGTQTPGGFFDSVHGGLSMSPGGTSAVGHVALDGVADE